MVGVVILIVGGLNHSEFKRRNPSIEPRYVADALERFSHRFPIFVAGGVGLILLDIIMLVGLSPDEGSLDLVQGIHSEDFLMAPFMFVMAFAVGILIWTGMQKSKYELSELTYIAHRQDLGADLPARAIVKSPERVRGERIMGVACGCIMMLAVIVFLVWGFAPMADQIGGWDGVDKWALKDAIRTGQGGFAISWIVFPVGGILCSIVWMVGSVIFKSQEDWIAEARQEDAWMKYAQANAEEDPWARNADDAPVPPAAAPTATQPRNPSSNPGSTWK